ALMQKNTRYSFRWCVLRTSYSPPPRPSTKGLPTGQFHWTDVASDLLRDLLPQLAQPLAHGLMANVGAVERAAEPRTLGRATGHEPECTYLGTDVKGCRGPVPSPQCSPRPGWIFGDPRGLARTRCCRKNRLQSATSPEKGCAVADLYRCSLTPSNPVSPTKYPGGI